eukprot:scaffold24023_cov221-Skeletonema_marinoi.AAC.4
MKLSWKNIHLTNEHIYDGRLTRHRGHGWDFSHLDNITETLLNRMPNLPNHDVSYMALFRALTIPVARDLVYMIMLPSSSPFPYQLGNYDWAPATDPSYGGRLFYLVCNADYSVVPNDENEARKHEYSSLFVVTPQDFATNAGGDYRVNYVNFSFLDEDGEEETLSWTRSDDPPLPDHLDQIVADHFEGVEEEERVRARGRIEQAVQTEIRKIRARHQEQLNLFFGDLNVSKITPVNFTDTSRSLRDSKSDPNNRLPGFNAELAPSSPAALLFSSGYAFARCRLTAFVRGVICANVEESFRRVDRVSSSSHDYVRNFIVLQHSYLTLTSSPIFGMDRIRLGHSNDRRSSRNITPGIISLEVTSIGSGRG